MRYFEVGYHVSEGVFSVNTITGDNGLEAATEAAQRHADKFGYEIGYIKEITAGQAEEARHRGRPTYPIN